MKKFFLTLLFAASVFISTGQQTQYIGLNVGEIQTHMEQSRSDFFFSKEVKTGNHHFLKYENVDQTKTLLFIMDDQGRCRYTKLMCDYSMLKQMQDFLNNQYQYQKNFTWRDYSPDTPDEYLIELRKQEWFFTIKTSRVKK
ncbi:MAG TPA: hypothetical protein VJ876_03270 [Bacteroidales bacterium]|nr:hypothetical protein [Bacteroidales bacterium]